MENKLEIFKNEEFGEMRILEQNKEVWFVGKDVAKILGYTNPQKAIRDHVEVEDRGVNETFTGTKATLINESGLYSLILSSKLPNAKKFKRWVTNEVLPSLRQTGGYIVGENQMNEDELVAAAMNVLNKKVERLQIENSKQSQLIGELKPKADYTDKILKSKDILPITAIAKDYGMSGTAMNRKLHDLGVQYNLSGQWLLYAKYQDKGYTHSETVPIYHTDGTEGTRLNTKWTQKGRLFLYELLKSNGLLPMIEREA